MPVEGRRLHNNNLSEDTLTVRRDGGNDGNKTGKNSREVEEQAKGGGLHSTAGKAGKGNSVSCQRPVGRNSSKRSKV